MARVIGCPEPHALQQLVLGHVAAPECEELIHHLEHCADCAAKLRKVQGVDTLVEAARGSDTLVEPRDQQVVRALIEQIRPKLHQAVDSAMIGESSSAEGVAETFSLACTGCAKSLKVKVRLAGKKVKCPHCGQVVLAKQAGAQQAGAMDAPTLAPSSASPRSQGEATHDALAGARPEDAEAWDFLAPPEQPDEMGRLGGYRVLQVLGRGGMGVVFKAEDPNLERLVALKAMLPSMAASPSAKKRFLREAKAAAALKHDHVVTIHQVGEDRGAPFLAMEFLHGEPLDERLKRDNVLPLPEVLRIGREIAEGLAAAHDQGLIHRDIKPGNVWLESSVGQAASLAIPQRDYDVDGTGKAACPTIYRVKILDFGLARSANDATNLTQSGAIVGTPAYMAPEQASGKPVDHRCDLFSLGCVLYRMCTGDLPFKGSDTLAILSSLAMDTPQAPLEIDGSLPPELSDLIVRLLAKDPVDRPAHARAVVEELRALENEATQATGFPARRTPPKPSAMAVSVQSERQARLPVATKKRLLVASAAAAVLALVAGAIVFFFPAGEGTLRVEIDDPSIEVTLAAGGYKFKTDKEEIHIRPGDHKLKIKRGGQEFDTEQFLLKKGEKVTLKVELLASRVTVLVDGRLLTAKDLPDAVAVVPGKVDGLPRGGIQELVWSPDGKWLAATFPLESKALILDAASLMPVRELATRGPAAVRLTWSPSSKYLAAAVDKGVRIFGLDGKDVVSLVEAPNAHLAWHPTQETLAAGAGDKLWLIKPDASKKELLKAAKVQAIEWSPDGGRLLANQGGGTAQIWLADGTHDKTVNTDKDYAHMLWTRDGKSLAVAGTKKVAQFSLDGKEEKALGGAVAKGVRGMKWHPAGNALVAVNPEGGVRFNPIALVGNKEWAASIIPEVASIQFNNDGRFLAMPNRGQDAVHVFECGAKVFAEVMKITAFRVRAVAWNPKSAELAVAADYPTSHGVLRVVDTKGKTLRSIRGPLYLPEVPIKLPPLLTASAFDKLDPADINEEELKIAGRTKINKKKPSTKVAGGPKVSEDLVAILGDTRWLTAEPQSVFGFSPDGKSLAARESGGFAIWDIDSGRPTASFGGHALSPTWEQVAEVGGSFTVRARKTNEVLGKGSIIGNNSGKLSVFSLDGKLLGVASRSVGPFFGKVFDARSGKQIMSVEACKGSGDNFGVEAIAFSPNGDVFVTSGRDGFVGKTAGTPVCVWWDVKSGKELHRLSINPTYFSFSPDGKTLATSGRDAANLWDVASGAKLRALPIDKRVHSATFSPDGALLVTLTDDGIELWDPEKAKLVRACVDSAGAGRPAFSPDGKTLAAFTRGGRVLRLWETETGQVKNLPALHTGAIATFGVSPDGTKITSVDSHGKLIQWDVAAAKAMEAKVTGADVTWAAMTDDGTKAILQVGGPVEVWSIGGTPARALKLGARPQVLGMDPSGRLLGIEPGSNTVGTFDTVTGNGGPSAAPGRASAMDISTDRRFIAMGGAGAGFVQLADAASVRALLHLSTHPNCRSIQFSPEDALLAAALGGSNAIHLLDLRSGELRLLAGHTASARTLAWRPDGKHVASVADNGVVLVHDLTRPEAPIIQTVHLGTGMGGVNQLRYTPDGRHLVTANGNGTLYVVRLAETAAPKAASQ